MLCLIVVVVIVVMCDWGDLKLFETLVLVKNASEYIWSVFLNLFVLDFLVCLNLLVIIVGGFGVM